jgi:hypothetical protein
MQLIPAKPVRQQKSITQVCKFRTMSQICNYIIFYLLSLHWHEGSQLDPEPEPE